MSNQDSKAEAHVNKDPKNSQISEQPSFTMMFDPLNKYKPEPEKTYFYPVFFNYPILSNTSVNTYIYKVGM